MYTQNRNNIERHVKTHSQRSDEDRSAVTILETFLRANGKISTNFSKEDKWPNIDGTLEFVENPLITRRPKQNFFVQIKGTHLYTETDNGIKYSLKSLAFPAFIYLDVTLDPGLLFVVLNPDCRGEERVFWKYMSVDFVNTLNYEHDSATLSFTSDEEIKNTNESIEAFCDKLSDIICHHTFVKQLDNRPYSRHDIEKIIRVCNEQISETIDKFEISQETRDSISKRILNRLYDLCSATLILNTIDEGFQNVTTRLAWERSLLNLDTKYLGTFLRGFSEDIGPKLLEREDDDEVILCLNYDGKFGLNNMNNYFQNANKKGEAISWREWTYKVGDPILFNETKRFPLLYNNLKGRIVGIVKDAESVTFTIDIEVILTEMDCQGQDFELVDVFDNSSRISLTVYAYDDNTSDLEDSSRMNSIVPFQLAYAVSIHKAQGLEYDSVKVIIPQSNSEKITHGIFYTAITRAKKKLKIYWSAETMKEIVSGFATNESNGKSLEIVKAKLAVTQ